MGPGCSMWPCTAQPAHHPCLRTKATKHAPPLTSLPLVVHAGGGAVRECEREGEGADGGAGSGAQVSGGGGCGRGSRCAPPPPRPRPPARLAWPRPAPPLVGRPPHRREAKAATEAFNRVRAARWGDGGGGGHRRPGSGTAPAPPGLASGLCRASPLCCVRCTPLHPSPPCAPPLAATTPSLLPLTTWPAKSTQSTRRGGGRPPARRWIVGPPARQGPSAAPWRPLLRCSVAAAPQPTVHPHKPPRSHSRMHAQACR